MKMKRFLCFLATIGMLLPLAGCKEVQEPVAGFEKEEDKLYIELPDLTTEYVESGFLEYRMINEGIQYGGIPSDAICINSYCAFRTLREVDETAENIEITLYYGGGADENTPIVSMELYYYIRGLTDKIRLRSIPKEEYVSEEYKIEFQTEDNSFFYDKNYYIEKIKYNHSEKVAIPASLLIGSSGVIDFFAWGTGEDNRLCYGELPRNLYYAKENGKIHFMSTRERAYVTKGALIYSENVTYV